MDERSCEYSEWHIDAYLDDELTAAEREAVVEHLTGCAACREYLREAQLVRSVLAAHREVPLWRSSAEARLAIEDALDDRPVGLGFGWVLGGIMIEAAFVAQAAAALMLILTAVQWLGLPVGAWLAPMARSLTGTLRPIGIEAPSSLRALHPAAGEWLSSSTLEAALSSAAALTIVLLLAVIGLAFYGWAAASQRRRLLYATNGPSRSTARS